MERRNLSRLAALQVVAIVAVVILLGRLWQVQLAPTGADDSSRLDRTAAAGSVTRQVVLPPVRGRILDATGQPLADNAAVPTVVADPVELSAMTDDERRATFDRLGRVLSVDPEELRARTVPCGTEGAVPGVCWTGSRYQPIPLATDLPTDVVLAVAERAEAYRGIAVEPTSVRMASRSTGVNAAHLVGYVAQPTPEGLERRDVEPGMLVGRAGLERVYDDELLGSPGLRTLLIDARGRVRRVAREEPPRAGNDLVTSIDADLQALVEDQLDLAIRRARERVEPATGELYAADGGAAAVLDVRTGRVLALASAPTFDPQLWRGGLSAEESARLFASDLAAPLLSRAVQGEYPPGSTFKPIVAAAGLRHGLDPAERLPCPPSMQIADRRFGNYGYHGYGRLDLAGALAVSCNTYFYRLGRELADSDENALVDTAERFGFGGPTGVDLPGEAAGSLPGSSAAEELSGAGQLALRAIGQAEITVTPLQLAVGYAAIANGGTVFRPTVGTRIVAPDGSTVRTMEPEVAGRLPLRAEQLDALTEALRTTAVRGTTSGVFAGFDLNRWPIASKTGTAEVGGDQPTAWLAGFDDRYAVVMVVSRAGTGSGTCGEAFRAIWDHLVGPERSVPE